MLTQSNETKAEVQVVEAADGSGNIDGVAVHGKKYTSKVEGFAISGASLTTVKGYVGTVTGWQSADTNLPKSIVTGCTEAKSNDGFAKVSLDLWASPTIAL
jgi:hypothetical protein